MLVLIYSSQAMSSPEDKAYEIMRELDVSYVLVIFGGLTGYSSDGKFVQLEVCFTEWQLCIILGSKWWQICCLEVYICNLSILYLDSTVHQVLPTERKV